MYNKLNMSGRSVHKGLNLDGPLYNSRIFSIYLEFLEKNYPNIDIGVILDRSNMTVNEIKDPGHWFSQRQANAFNQAAVELTGNPKISQDAGRGFGESDHLGPIRKYALSFVLTSAFLTIDRHMETISRAVYAETRSLDANRVEISIRPKEGVKEELYQCENRTGIFEAIGKLFSGQNIDIEHPECTHRGDTRCRYIIKYKKNALFYSKRIANALTVSGTLINLFLFFVLPINQWLYGFLSSLAGLMAVFLFVSNLSRKTIMRILEEQGKSARDHIREVFEHYDNTLFIQELSEAGASDIDGDNLLTTMLDIMNKRLYFDFGSILLLDKEDNKLDCVARYGFDDSLHNLIEKTPFPIKNDSTNPLVKTFINKKPCIYNDIEALPEVIYHAVIKTNLRSFIVLPIVYKENSIGVLAVGNKSKRRVFRQADINLLQGIASQCAINLNNVLSFKTLQERERDHRLILDNFQGVIYRYQNDSDRKIEYLSEGCSRLLGYTPSDLPSFSFYNKHIVHREFQKHRIKTIKQSIAKKKEFELEYKIVQRRGKHLWVLEKGRPVFEGHSCVAIEGFLMDISDKKMAEVALIESEKIKTEFVTTASHELRTPLTIIELCTTGLIGGYSGEIPQKAKRHMQMIKNGIDRMLVILDNMLDLSKMEAGRVELELTKENIQNIVLQAKEEADSLMAGHKHSLIIRHFGEAQTMLLDKKRTLQVLENLLTNAAKYTPDGGVIVFSSRVASKDAKFIEISVADNGYGIPKWASKKIFDKFFQADSILSNKVGGAGLGLSISQRIVKQHGGTLTCLSPLDNGNKEKVQAINDMGVDTFPLGGERKGSCFTVAIPYRKV